MMSSQNLEADRKLVALHFLIFGLIVGTFTANIPYVQAEQVFAPTDIGHLILSINLGNVIGVYIGRRRCFTARALFKTMAAALILGLIGIGVADGKAQCIAAGLALGAGSGLLQMFVNSSAALIESHYGVLVLPKMHAEFSKGVVLGALGSLLVAIGQLPYMCGFILLIGPVIIGSRFAFAAPSLFSLSDTDSIAPSAPSDRRGYRRVLAVLGAVAFICVVVEGALMGWSGLLLKDGLQVPEGLLPLGVLTFTLFSFLIRRHGDRLITACGGRARALALSLFVAAALSVSLGFLSNAWLGLAAVAVIGMGTALVMPIVFSLAGSLVVNVKSRLVSDISLIGYAASILGPLFIAGLASRYGIKASLSCLAFALVAGLLVVAVGKAVLTAADTVGQSDGRP
jgi:hypothetical protein